jgi:hypothetical protein
MLSYLPVLIVMSLVDIEFLAVQKGGDTCSTL